jgi:3-oxoadipate enol-lactonase / 4-carboxymuconolactone decarboxylase
MFVKADELVVHVQIDGPPEAPSLLMLHSLGTSLHVWDAQARALAGRWRVIRPDLRGHGLTGVPPGPYSIAQMARDLLALLDALDVAGAHVAGLSIGGAIAQSLAAQAGARVRSLVLCDTAMTFAPAALWHERAAIARRDGMAPLVEPVLARWVTEDFRDTPAAEGLRAMLRRTDPQGYAGAAEALADADLTAATATLRLPTLVLVGEHDQATPPATARAIQAAIPGAELTVLPGVAHIPTMQWPDDVTGAIAAFLARQGH